MTIDEKLRSLTTTRHLESTPVPLAGIEELGIRQGVHLTNCLFEPSVELSSTVISRDLSTFIGAHSYVNDGGYLRGNVFIGRYCSIGRRVSIGAGNHPLASLGTHPRLVYGKGSPYSDREREIIGVRPERGGHIAIGNDVWIGDGAVIVPGVRIGTGAVIGANTVITRDVASYAIMAGSPARLIRYRFPEDLIESLLQSEWWEYPLDLVRSLPVVNVFEFLSECKTVLADSSLKCQVETYSIQR